MCENISIPRGPLVQIRYSHISLHAFWYKIEVLGTQEKTACRLSQAYGKA